MNKTVCSGRQSAENSLDWKIRNLERQMNALQTLKKKICWETLSEEDESALHFLISYIMKIN